MDELTAPLGQLRLRAPRRSPVTRTLVIALAILLLAGTVIWFLPLARFVHEEGRSAAQSRRVQMQAPPPAAPADPKPTGSIQPSSEPASRIVTIIDGITGKRQEVTIAAPEPAPGPAPPQPRR
jgi:hypothetical protein